MTTNNSIQSDPRLLAALVKTMGEAVTLSNAEGCFYLYSPKMEMITGYTREEAGKLGDLLALLYRDLAQYRFAMSVVSEIYQWDCRERETVIRAKEGTLKILLVSTSVIKRQDEEFYLSVCRDITAERHNTREQTKSLNGVLPICASCKKIRDGQDFWHQIETYISEHTDAMFSHGVCPDCAKRSYPKYFGAEKREEN